MLDQDGKVVDAVPEDQSFTHTLIEMFMVEANEAVARLLDSLQVPFLRRTHPTPADDGNDRLRSFAQVAGFKLPKDMDRQAIQGLLAAVKGKPEGFAINLAVLRSLTRAEYSPKAIGHYAAGQRTLRALHQPHSALRRSDGAPASRRLFRGEAAPRARRGQEPPSQAGARRDGRASVPAAKPTTTSSSSDNT